MTQTQAKLHATKAQIHAIQYLLGSGSNIADERFAYEELAQDLVITDAYEDHSWTYAQMAVDEYGYVLSLAEATDRARRYATVDDANHTIARLRALYPVRAATAR